MKMKSIILAVALLLCNVATTYSREDLDRTKRPVAKAAPKVALPETQKITLKNGLQIMLVEHHELPIVSFNLVIVFGLFHSLNPEVEKMGFSIMIFYVGTGFLLGIMTLMDEGLELALGFHLGNNLIAALLITSDFSAIQTDAIFKYTSENDTVSILSEMIVSMLMVYPIILFIFVKKYRWTNWKAKLTGKIHP